MTAMRHILLLLLLLAAQAAAAQKEFNTWCFGNNIGPSRIGPNRGGGGIKMQFDAQGPVAPAGAWTTRYAIGSTSFGSDGTATISDAAGNFLFFTNGLEVVDRLNRRLPNGDFELLRDTDRWWGTSRSSLTTAIVPAPGGQYYIFYWSQGQLEGQPAYTLTYSVVDPRRNGGYGDVVRKNVRLTSAFVPQLTVLRHRNNRDFWVVARDPDSRGFHAFLLGPHGLDPTPVVSLAGQAAYPDQSVLMAAPNGQRLACAAQMRAGAVSEWQLCLYDFDNASGAVAGEQIFRRVPVPPIAVNNSGRPQTAGPFSATCFSPDSRVLYTCEANDAALVAARRLSDVWQYDLTRPTAAAIGQSRFWVSNVPALPPPNDHIGATSLQLTPDGQVWINQFHNRDIVRTEQPLTFNSPSAGLIRHPNVVGASCGFVAEGYFYLPGQQPYSTPFVISNMLFAPPTLNYEAGCPEDSVRFWASSAGEPAGLRWDFGDPASGPANAATGGMPAHRYAQGGTYAVRLTLANGQQLTRTVAVAGQAGDFTHENVFTPNGDGLNDWFTPVRQPLPGGRLQVFARWGQLMYQTEDPALRWDGTGAAAGAYFYLLDLPDCQGVVRHNRGTVTLVR